MREHVSDTAGKFVRMSNKIKTKSMSRSERKFDEKAIKSIERLGLESEGQEEADNERMSVIATSMLAISESLHKEIDLVSKKLEAISVFPPLDAFKHLSSQPSSTPVLVNRKDMLLYQMSSLIAGWAICSCQ